MNYTSIEQSKKLLEIGLNPESADMFYFRQIDSDYFPPNVISIIPTPIIINDKDKPDYNFDIPCWSVGALMELMPKRYPNYIEYRFFSNTFDNRGNRLVDVWCISFNDYAGHSHTIYNMDLICACYDMVVWLLENGHIKKGE